jgi:ATP-binding cassette subfamily B protein RaxB
MAFGIVVALRLAGRAVRSLTLQYVSGVVSYDMQTKLFRRLLHLPLDWFQKRQVGDIQNRFRSLQPIQQFISNGLVASLLDGGLGAVVLVLMFYYSAALGIVVVCSLTIYIVLRLLLLEMSQRMASDALVSEAREQSRFLETLRAAQTIKASGAEAMREAQQRNAIAATIGASMRVGNLSVSYGAAAEAVTGLTDVVIVFAAASAIMSGDMTVGMFMAFMAYKLQFIDRSMRLIETVISWRLLDVQLDRVADIALSSAEPTNVSGRRDPIAGAMECHDVAFSYGSHERAVLANFNLLVRAGECVAIAGPSGCGKSTLVKLITGLYQPTSGAICIDDVPMPEWDHQFLRSRIGVVTQDDALMTGSVAENIAGFDDQVDFERVRECARTAHIDADIMSMPMGYGTLVGDLGSSLSGGQRQRIMIARALYRAPSILVLDEATSHLDVENERAINAALGKLKITRIIVAHRPETLRSADRIEFIGPGGRRVDVPPLLQPTG